MSRDSRFGRLEKWLNDSTVAVLQEEDTFETTHIDEVFNDYSALNALELGHEALGFCIASQEKRDPASTLGLRLVFTLEESETLNTEFPDIESWTSKDLDVYTPPVLYVQPFDVNFYVPYSEQYRRPLPQAMHKPKFGKVLAWYSAQRSIEYLPEETGYSRDVFFDYIPSPFARKLHPSHISN